MTVTSTAEKILLRTHPHRTKLYLSVFQPSTVLACQVNDASIARNDYQITFNNVTQGSWTAVEAGMTLLIGSTAGADDIGRIRIRSITSSQITVAENSNINWQDALFLTVLRYWESWPVFPRIISDPADPTNTIWYKDYDIVYTNQNTILGAFPCAGPHRAAFTGDSIYYSATGTSHVADASMSYNWWFEGGTVTGSSALSPGNIIYNTPGHYVTRLQVSGSNGSVDTTYRYVSIYDRPETGSANVPVSRWSMGNIDGSRSGGGYTVSITVHETLDLDEGDVVVLFGETWYGSTYGTIGGNAVGNSDIFFVGHILKDSIVYNYKQGEVTFEVGSITQYMKEQEGFSISVESKASPAYWYEVNDMDINKAMFHYLRWQSTVLYLADFQSLIKDRPIQYYDSDRTSLYDAVDGLARGAMLGGITSDIQGKIWAEHGAQAFPSQANQSYTPLIFVPVKQDWIGSPRITEQLIPSSSYIEYGGIAFSGAITGTFVPLMSNAPGAAPLYRGRAERKQGLALIDQFELNSITGNTLANNNYAYPTIEYRMGGTYRNIDIAPQEKHTLQVEAADTPRGVAISGTFMPDRISWLYDPQKQSFLPNNVGYVPLKVGLAGQTIVIPQIVDDGGFGTPGGGAGVKIPPIPQLYFPPLLSNITTPAFITRLAPDLVISSGGNDYLVFSVSDNSYNDAITFRYPSTGLLGSDGIDLLKAGIYRISIGVTNTWGTTPTTNGGSVSIRRNRAASTVNIFNYYFESPTIGGDIESVYFSKIDDYLAGDAIGIQILNTSDQNFTAGAAYIAIELIQET